MIVDLYPPPCGRMRMERGRMTESCVHAEPEFSEHASGSDQGPNAVQNNLVINIVYE